MQLKKTPPKVLHNRFVEIAAPVEGAGMHGKPGRYRDLKMAVELKKWQLQKVERARMKAILKELEEASESGVLEGAQLGG